MVTVDEAGGALQSPESSSFHRATAPNMLYKIRDTNLHGSESFSFFFIAAVIIKNVLC